MWRDPTTRSTQNRVGLRNPGARAAAAFLGERRWHLPPVFGINIAVSPGVTDLEQEQTEVLESLAFFVEQRVLPTWFTLNLSCPNTEDDPGGHQTEARTRQLCAAVIAYLRAAAHGVPLWVKVGPDLYAEQYRILMRVFAEEGVAAVVATNTLGLPAPDQPEVLAGVGGGRIHQQALAAVSALVEAGAERQVDVIGCGGVMDADSAQAFRARGAKAVQYWSALVYRGPLAAAHILHEWKQTYG
jgi:dihydroorotate dehydrogenase